MEMGEVDIVVGKFVSIRIFDGVEIKKRVGSIHAPMRQGYLDFTLETRHTGVWLTIPIHPSPLQTNQ